MGKRMNAARPPLAANTVSAALPRVPIAVAGARAGHDGAVQAVRRPAPELGGARGQRSYGYAVTSALRGQAPACADRTPWSAPRIAALVAATFADLYPSFQLRGIGWPARTAAAKAALNENSDDAALFKTLETMLAGIDDPHVELHAEV